MTEPFARPTQKTEPAPVAQRQPRAFTSDEAEALPAEIVAEFEAAPEAELVTPPAPRRGSWLRRAVLWAAGLLVTLGLGLAADALIRDLFARYEWLGWLGSAALAIFVLGVLALGLREIWAVRRLSRLDHLREQAEAAIAGDHRDRALAVAHSLDGIYAPRADLAAARARLGADLPQLFDGAEIVQLTERMLMSPLDARAKGLIAASARRVALVTAVSPRALVDIAFVAYESVRLGGTIASLYGARPGFFGFWRLAGAILSHLAVTGGLVLTDGIVEQLVGQSLASKLSARLGEGVVNGLMTVRVGIAAMRVVRPLPFTVLKQPLVRDFVPELANVAAGLKDPPKP